VIILLCLALGLLLRVASAGSLQGLSETQIWGETLLLGLLVAQAAIPLLRLSGTGARIAFFAWLATLPLMAGIAWRNHRAPGMAVLGVGLVLNLVVIAANGGMPVFPTAVAAVSTAARAGAIPSADFIHVVAGSETKLPWLADVIPLMGPAWLRLVASPGDLLLYAGIVAFLGGGGKMRRPAGSIGE
jgi:hypothetical protein